MSAVTTGNRPLEIFQRLCDEQGRKKGWVARHAGLTAQSLGKRFRGIYGYTWKPGEREAIAKALGVPADYIWPELAKPQSEATS